MKISCVPKEGRRGVFVVLVEDEPWREVHSTIFGRKPGIPTKVESQEVLEASFQELERHRAKRYALWRLSSKALSSGELRKALVDRLVSEEVAEKVVTECVQSGYINDQEWVESFVRSQLARHLGPQAIAAKLQAKGVSSELIQETLEQFDDAELRYQRINHLLATRYRNRDLSNYHEKQKVIAALARKGFSFSDIQAVMKS